MTYRFNVSEGLQNYSQRNNLFLPSSACNATSAAMFLTYSQEDFYAPAKVALDDYIMATMLSKWGFDKFKLWAPQLADTTDYLPNEIHLVIAWAINSITGMETVKYFDAGDLRWMFDSFIKGYPVILSGVFAGLHHIVCGVGFETTQARIKTCHWTDIDLSKIKSVVVDDPWGDYSSKYTNHKGNDIVIPWEEFLSMAKGQSSNTHKRMHLHRNVHSNY